jgi:hypothetical protein
LLDDVLNTSTAIFAEPGLRTGSDPSNPAQFKNLQTGWIDLSVIFPLPSGYSSTTYSNAAGSLGSYSVNVSDDSEKIMRTLWTQRYNQVYQNFYNQAWCSPSGSNICDRAAMGRCVRELVIVEFRSVVNEFLSEAKLLFPGQSSFTRDDTFVAPVELTAAKLFDLHFAAPVQTACNNLNTYSTDVLSTCLNTAHTVALPVQRDLNQVGASTITSYINDLKSYGVGSLNAYLAKLGVSQQNYSLLSDNILTDLRGSRAEYAINFGIFENILAQDSRAVSANATCYTNLQFPSNPQSVGQMLNSVGAFLTTASSQTLCTLLKDMGTTAISTGQLHPHMFRVEPSNGGCS